VRYPKFVGPRLALLSLFRSCRATSSSLLSLSLSLSPPSPRALGSSSTTLLSHRWELRKTRQVGNWYTETRPYRQGLNVAVSGTFVVQAQKWMHARARAWKRARRCNAQRKKDRIRRKKLIAEITLFLRTPFTRVAVCVACKNRFCPVSSSYSPSFLFLSLSLFLLFGVRLIHPWKRRRR